MEQQKQKNEELEKKLQESATLQDVWDVLAGDVSYVLLSLTTDKYKFIEDSPCLVQTVACCQNEQTHHHFYSCLTFSLNPCSDIVGGRGCKEEGRDRRIAEEAARSYCGSGQTFFSSLELSDSVFWVQAESYPFWFNICKISQNHSFKNLLLRAPPEFFSLYTSLYTTWNGFCWVGLGKDGKAVTAWRQKWSSRNRKTKNSRRNFKNLLLCRTHGTFWQGTCHMCCSR